MIVNSFLFSIRWELHAVEYVIESVGLLRNNCLIISTIETIMKNVFKHQSYEIIQLYINFIYKFIKYGI